MLTQQFFPLSQSVRDTFFATFGTSGADVSRVAIPAAILFLLTALMIRLRRSAIVAEPAAKTSPAPSAEAEQAQPHPATAPAHRPRTSLLTDPVQQMTAITSVEFETVRLYSREANRLRHAIEVATRNAGNTHRVMSQTSLGDVLRPRHGTGSMAELQDAFTSLSLKRLDFAVFDGFGQIVCAIEYEGYGKRDVVKREVLRRVGVPTVVVSREFDDADVTRRIAQILSPDAAGSQHGHAAVHV